MGFLTQILIVIIVTFCANSMETYTSQEVNKESTKLYASDHLTIHSYKKAFQILDNKCNVCHRKRNKKRIFNKENMNLWAHDIYEQVFVKKRMPKGKKIKLTASEYQELFSWITFTKNNQNGHKL